MFLNPKRKRNPYTKSSKKTVRYFPGSTTKKTRMAKKTRKKSRKRYARRKLSVSVRKSRRSATIRIRARRGRGSGKLRIKRTRHTRAVSVYSVKANPRRRRRSARRSMRRSMLRNPFGGNLMTTVKGVFSIGNLSIAGGALAATALSRFLIDKTITSTTNTTPWNLPLLNKDTAADSRGTGVILYTVLTPVATALLIRNKMPNLSKGLMLGAVINGVSELMRQNSPDNYYKYIASPQEAYAAALLKPTTTTTTTVKGYGAYLNRSNIPNMLPVGLMPGNRSPGYSGSNLFPRVRTTNGALDNSRAFPTDAW